jgi:hypothetical protein
MGIISSRTRNPPEEWLFHRKLSAHGLGSHQRNGIRRGGITSSWTRSQVARFKCEKNFPIGNNFLKRPLKSRETIPLSLCDLLVDLN